MRLTTTHLLAATCFAALLFLGSSLAASRVCAQSTDAATNATARSLFEEGVAFAEAGKWAEAADKFQRSLALRPSQVVTFNYATALIELGRLVEASELLQGIRREPNTTPQMKRRVDTMLETLRVQLAWLTVQLNRNGAPEPQDRVAILDGHELPEAALGVPRAVDPGKRTLELRVDGRVVWSRSINVAAGESQEATIDVPAATTNPNEPATAPSAAETAAHAQTTSTQAPQQALAHDDSDSPGPWLWIGIGGAVVVVTVVAIIAASSGGTKDGPVFEAGLGTITIGAQP